MPDPIEVKVSETPVATPAPVAAPATLSLEQIEAQLKALADQAKAMRAAKKAVFSVSISETVQKVDSKGRGIVDLAGNKILEPGKGTVKANLGGRFPLSLRRSQWLKLAEHMSEIVAFCNDPANIAKIEAAEKAYEAFKAAEKAADKK